MTLPCTSVSQELLALEAERQPFVIDAEQVHQGGLEIVNVDRVFRRR